MPDKNWKRFERNIATLFNATRTPVLGDIDADIKSPDYFLWIDCKLRKEVPATYGVMLSHAEALGFEAVAWSLPEGPKLIIMRTPTVRELTQRPPKYIWSDRAPRGDRPWAWVEHIALSAPEPYLPCIVMSRPGTPSMQAVAVFDADRLGVWMVRWAALSSGKISAFGEALSSELLNQEA
ncbi:hypothetical protein [Aggregatilinea lenta]|uniref:hypothetical protein n=1 Tax=Aggregatilinea lenta TaxID=913108 RepID=UPI000E5C24B7|nr:hypothetical protein [Aggregatilinea lenta]